jgi:hypothetical protein
VGVDCHSVDIGVRKNPVFPRSAGVFQAYFKPVSHPDTQEERPNSTEFSMIFLFTPVQNPLLVGPTFITFPGLPKTPPAPSFRERKITLFPLRKTILREGFLMSVRALLALHVAGVGTLADQTILGD